MSGKSVRQFILGTDWWTDCDDVLALRLLANAVKSGEAELLGVCISAYMPLSERSMSAFLAYEGLSEVPIGIDRDATDYGGSPPYQARLAEMPQSGTAAEDALELYVRMLRAASSPIELIEIGYPQVLAALIRREPLLVREKVGKLWMMAGRWDQNPGKENNFARAPRSREAGARLCAEWPTEITFLGYECGVNVISGGFLPQSDPVRAALADHGSPKGRCSWDPLCVRLALLGADAAGYALVRGTASVDGESGENSFAPSADGRHAYTVCVKEPLYYENELNKGLTSREKENGQYK